MNSQQLEAVEKLITYSGLEAGKAREYLEKSHWNVDAAYRQHKANRMAQSGFQQQPAKRYPAYSGSPAGLHPAPITIPIHTSNQNKQPLAYAKPLNYKLQDGLGMAMTGMGPAVGANLHPVFQPQQHVPKFPVETPKERIVPVQVEKVRPVVDRSQPVSMASNPSPAHYQMGSRPEAMHKPQTYTIPVQINHQARPVQLDQSHQSRPVHVEHQPRSMQVEHQPRLSRTNNDNTHIVKADFIVGDTYPTSTPIRGGNSTQCNPIKENNSVIREDERRPPLDGRLSPPKTLPATSSPKILKRGFSRISQNAFLVDEERKNVLNDIAEDCHDNMYVQTFVLPDISGYPDDFRDFLEKDLIEMSTLVSLEQAGRLNWWAELGVCQRLLPMATTGDGNCLLHAASLAMWGIHDRQLMLRKALFDTLTKKYYRDALYRRWRLQQTQANKEADLIFSENEWQKEWENVLRLASTTPRSLPGTLNRKNSCCDSMVTQSKCSDKCKREEDSDSPVVYESLEEFHVFVLAHVIQRPIIVVADTILRDASGEAMAPIPFGGIYMPVECDPSHCYRSPLLLTYDAAHFSALVPMERNHGDDTDKQHSLPIAIPIVSTELTTLPLHFAIDPGIHYNWEKNNGHFSMPEESKINLLKKYMDVEKLPINGQLPDSNSDKNSTGSYESDDGLIERGKKKDKDKKGNSVSKQFGSFGKSVGKKLKNLGKGSLKEKSTSGGSGSGVGSGGSLGRNSTTQPIRLPLTISALSENDRQSLWCCRLTMKKSDTHQRMTDNYLYDAQVRFKNEISSPRIKRKENGPAARRVQCVTNGCNMFGTAETSYLCSKCFNDQKKVIIDQEKDRLREFEHHKHGAHLSHHHKHGKDEADGIKVGSKSRFYDMKPERVNDIQPQPQLIVDLNDSQQSKGVNSIKPQSAQSRPRTPSPDYDNVSYKADKLSINPTTVQQPCSSPKPEKKTLDKGRLCRSPDCDFYGSEKTDFYCSGCYKRRQDLRQV